MIYFLRLVKNSALFFILCVSISTVHAERIKDLSSVQGMRDNQLIGYGLVVGLDGSGDSVGQVSFTAQSLKNMLSQLGIVLPPGVKPQPKNVAAVILHATLPPFVKKGQKIDVTASSVGNAKSLRGGTLLMSPLKGADGKVYAVAQGSLLVSKVLMVPVLPSMFPVSGEFLKGLLSNGPSIIH